MFQNPNTSAPPKTNCVSCGAPSKWPCQGCGQWYCQQCAPQGLCPTHFGMLDHEDREAIKRVMKLVTPSNKTKLTIVMAIFIPVIFYIIAVIFVPSVADLIWTPVIAVVVIMLTLLLFIIFLPLRKDLPRLKAMAQKYNFSGMTGTPPPSHDTTRDYKSLPIYSTGAEATPTRPMSNLEMMRQKFGQKKPIQPYGSHSTPSVRSSTSKMVVIVVAAMMLTVGLYIFFTLFS